MPMKLHLNNLWVPMPASHSFPFPNPRRCEIKFINNIIRMHLEGVGLRTAQGWSGNAGSDKRTDKRFYKLSMEKCEESLAAKLKSKQVFGSGEVKEDRITCLKFDASGEYLCLGDNEGRIIIFKAEGEDLASDYQFFTEFHPQLLNFDSLTSNDIPQGIVDICWMNPQGKYLKLFTTNSRFINLYRCSEKVEKKIMKAPTRELCLPKFNKEEPNFEAVQLKSFPCLHRCDINSISKSNNEQYLLTSDKDRCLFWNIEKQKTPYIPFDLTSKKEIVENFEINCSKLHPTSDSLFLVGTNKNMLGMCDLREPSFSRTLQFGVDVHSMKNFFTDMASSVNSAEFTQDGRYLISRQYLNVKVWDVKQTRKPVLNVCVQQSLKEKLVDLFECGGIDDKFSISGNADSSTIITGNYNSTFHSMNIKTGENYQYEPNFDNKTIRRQIFPGRNQPPFTLDASRRISTSSFHPNGRCAAVSLLNSFFIYGP